jgi:hypothetical protein
MSSLGRDLMNRLIQAGNAIGSIIEYSVYTNKKGYASSSMKINGERAEWKYSIDDLKDLVVENTVVKKGKQSVERDYYAVETKLINELLMIYPPKPKDDFTPVVVLSSTTPAKTAILPEPAKRGAKGKLAVPAGEEDDDLPF